MATVLIIVALVVSIGYLSKPDRGGVSRCSRVFAISEFEDYAVIHKPFLTWKPFESPKFLFEISNEGYEQLAAELKRQGYSKWESGGLSFGSVDVGWTEAEDNVYCEFSRHGCDYYWSYSAKKKLIYAISFPS